MKKLEPYARALSPAKINLVLKITGIRKDGYHNLATLFQMVDLCDTLLFYPAPKGEIRVTCPKVPVPENRNIVYLAARSIWRRGLSGVHIHIEKRIPHGAGLGGGSSNAATTLLTLNKIWKLGLSNSALRAKGLRLGADVPFFLFAPRAWATGRGEKLTRLPAGKTFYVLLVKPRINISTKKMYAEFDRRLTKSLQLVRIPSTVRKVVSYEHTVRMLDNDLEPAVIGTRPVIGRIRSMLESLGSNGVMVSGSGSALFALFPDSESAVSAYQKISKKSWWCAVSKTVSSVGHLGKTHF